jgi:hypothetical protein
VIDTATTVTAGVVRQSARIKRDRQAALDAMAQAAWTQGYLYGIGKPNIARALARKRTKQRIRQRRAELEVARALRNR